MHRSHDLAGHVADIAFRMASAENVRVDAKHVDGVAPELKFVGIIFDCECYAGRIILFDQAILMERPRLRLACALVAGVIADDARVAGESFGVLSNQHRRRQRFPLLAHFGYARISGKNAFTVAR